MYLENDCLVWLCADNICSFGSLGLMTLLHLLWNPAQPFPDGVAEVGWELLSAASKALANTLAGTEVFVKMISVPHVLPRGCGSGDCGPAYHATQPADVWRNSSSLQLSPLICFFWCCCIKHSHLFHSSGLTSKLTWVFCGRTLWLLVWWLVKQRDASWSICHT